MEDLSSIAKTPEMRWSDMANKKTMRSDAIRVSMAWGCKLMRYQSGQGAASEKQQISDVDAISLEMPKASVTEAWRIDACDDMDKVF